MRKVLEFVKTTIIVLVFCVVIPGICGNIETHYTREATVVAIQGNKVIVEDTRGNEWSFYGGGFVEGDKVKMRMFTNYTDSNIYDDEIKDVKLVK